MSASPPSGNGTGWKFGKVLLYTSLGGAVQWICQKAGHSLAPHEITGVITALAATGDKLLEATEHLSVHVIGERLGHTLFHSDEQHRTASGLNHDIERVLTRAAARTIIGLMDEWEKVHREFRASDFGQFELEELRDACANLLKNSADSAVPECIAEWLAALDQADILENSGLEKAPWARPEPVPPPGCKFAEFFAWRFPAAFEGNFADEVINDARANAKFTLLLQKRTIALLGSNAAGILGIESKVAELAASLQDPNPPWLDPFANKVAIKVYEKFGNSGVAPKLSGNVDSQADGVGSPSFPVMAIVWGPDPAKVFQKLVGCLLLKVFTEYRTSPADWGQPRTTSQGESEPLRLLDWNSHFPFLALPWWPAEPGKLPTPDQDAISKCVMRHADRPGEALQLLLILPTEITASEGDSLRVALDKSASVTATIAGPRDIEKWLPRHPALHARYSGVEAAKQFSIWKRDFTSKAVAAHRNLQTFGFPSTHSIVRSEHDFLDPNTFNLRDVFVPQLATSSNGISYTLDQVLTVSGGRCVLLGDPGSGKTSILRHLACEYGEPPAVELSNSPKFVPLFLSLRNFANNRRESPTLLEAIASQARYDAGLLEGDVDLQRIEAMLAMGEAVLLFDGLDEAGDVHTRQDISRLICTFSQDYPLCPVLVTSRKIGYQQAPLPAYIFQSFTVEPFSLKQQTAFIHKWCDRRLPGPEKSNLRNDQIDSFLEAIRVAAPDVQEMASNPLLLTLMAWIHDEMGHLPPSRGDLFDECVEMLLYRRDDKRFSGQESELERMVPPITHHVARGYYGALALKAQELNEKKGREGRGLIPNSSLVSWLEGLRFNALKREIHDEDERKRKAVDQAVTFLDFGEQRCGLLRDRGDDSRAFVHLSFQEFLAAERKATPFPTDFPKLIELAAFIVERCTKAAWRETLLLLFYHLRRSEVPRKDTIDDADFFPDWFVAVSPWLFSSASFSDTQSLAVQLGNPARPIDNWIRNRLSAEATTALTAYLELGSDPEMLLSGLSSLLQEIANSELKYESKLFGGVQLRSETRDLLSQDPQGDDLIRLNRLLLEDAYPLQLAKGLSARSGAWPQLTGRAHSFFTTSFRTSTRPIDRWIFGRLPESIRNDLDEYRITRDALPLQKALLQDLNNVLQSQSIYSLQLFDGIELRPGTKELLSKKQHQRDELIRLNRLLLEDAYPSEFSKKPPPEFWHLLGMALRDRLQISLIHRQLILSQLLTSWFGAMEFTTEEGQLFDQIARWADGATKAILLEVLVNAWQNPLSVAHELPILHLRVRLLGWPKDSKEREKLAEQFLRRLSSLCDRAERVSGIAHDDPDTRESRNKEKRDLQAAAIRLRAIESNQGIPTEVLQEIRATLAHLNRALRTSI
jgi:hypothetical protein